MISTELFNALQSWMSEGNRRVNISLKNVDSEVFAYDRDIGEGVIVESISDIPSVQELKEKKRESALAMLSSLEDGR